MGFSLGLRLARDGSTRLQFPLALCPTHASRLFPPFAEGVKAAAEQAPRGGTRGAGASWGRNADPNRA
jgi:hypothetical protein